MDLAGKTSDDAYDLADHFTRNLIEPTMVGAKIPIWDEWMHRLFQRMRDPSGATPQQAWERRLNSWRVMRPVRFSIKYRRVDPYGAISFDAWQPESDAYISTVTRLVAKLGKMARRPPDGGFDTPVIVTDSVESKTGLTVEVLCPTLYPTKTDATDLWLRANLRWMLLHELDEFIEISGDRPHHPHRGGRTPTPADLGMEY